MPHSWYFPTTLIQDKVARLAPRSVADIGSGFGKWGFLLREQLDWNLGRVAKADWTAQIVGVEVFPYESPLHDWVYDELIREDALNIVERLVGFDLVLLCDVIEHIEKRVALSFLRHMVSTNRNVIVCTPLDFFEQEISDNEYEHHISHWSMTDFKEFTYDYDQAGGAAMVVTLAGNGASWPSRRDMAASRLTYTMLGLKRRSGAARLVKQVVGRALRTRTAAKSWE